VDPVDRDVLMVIGCLMSTGLVPCLIAAFVHGITRLVDFIRNEMREIEREELGYEQRTG